LNLQPNTIAGFLYKTQLEILNCFKDNYCIIKLLFWQIGL